MTTQMARPAAKEMSIALIGLILILGGAFLAASITRSADFFSLKPLSGNNAADVFEEAQRLDLHRTFFTAWAALILVTPALCTFLFRRSSQSAAKYWLAFWSISFIAFAVHFYWAVSVMFGGDWSRILQADARVSAPALDTVVAVWWGLDVLLTWLLTSERSWVRVERTLIHVLVFVLFVLGSAMEGERTESRVLGVAMGVAVLTSFAIWLVRWRTQSKKAFAPAI